MALTIYGSPRSRTMRVLWTAAELGLSYEHVPLEWDDPALKAPDFLALNPAGTIPTLVDDGMALAESLAINLYLAKTYGAGGRLYPADRGTEAQIWRWSLWAQAHLEPWVQRDTIGGLRARAGDEVGVLLAAGLRALDRALAGRDWLTCEHFTVGDLNVAAVLSPSRMAEVSLEACPNVAAWLAQCYDRPAARETRRATGTP
ncbi:MAG: glutathione S-transferase family protein [Pseudomonadota bacterium]